MKRVTVWKFLRRLGFGMLGLILLAALILTEEYYRGKWAWEQYQRDATARGVSFDPRPFIPPPVPDDQNFAMTPLLKPLFGTDADYRTALSKRLELTPKNADAKRASLGGMGNGKRTDLKKWGEYLGNPDVLEALKKFAPQLDEISKASRMRFARFPLRYEDGLSTSMPHATLFIKISHIYSLRALAALDAGQTDRALADVESIFQLAESIEGEPLLISQLVRASLFSLSMQAVWEGIETHRWSDGQLLALEGRMERINLLPGALRSVKYELAAFPEAMQKTLNDPKTFVTAMAFVADVPTEGHLQRECLRLVLKSTWHQNVLTSYRFDEAYLLPAIDLDKRRVGAGKLKEAEQQLQALNGIFSPYTFLANLRASAVYPSLSKFAYTQTTVDQALIACALERYRLAHGEFPEKLDALVPQYVAKLPHDIINGQPLHYRRTPDGLYLLYSLGWNEADDNGTTVLVKDFIRQDIKQGDWVWSHLATPASAPLPGPTAPQSKPE